MITSGGVSTGEEDHVRAAIEAVGTLEFWRVAIKPGRPVALGELDGTPLLGLPGNPVAALVTFTAIGRPLLDRLAGAVYVAAAALSRAQRLSPTARRPGGANMCACRSAPTARRSRYPKEGAGILTSLTGSDALMELPEDMTALAPGDPAPCIPLGLLLWLANRTGAEFLVAPDPDDPALTRAVDGIDHTGAAVSTRVPVERPLTLFLNGQEIVTMMTIGDRPDCLAVGYLLNQGMLRRDDTIERIDVDAELDVVVVRTPDAHRFRGQAAQAHPDQRLRPGHRLRRPAGAVRDSAARPGRRTAHELAVCAGAQDQHQAEPVPDRRRHPWLRAVRTGPAAGVHGGCRPP